MNIEDRWYPWLPIKYKRDTAHLNLAECGAYRRLIDEYMLTGEGLPDNDASLARILGVGKDEWLVVATAVRPYFEASHGKLVHSRCEQELNTQRIRSVQRTESATRAVNTRWSKYRENKEIIRRVYATNTPTIRNDTTLHNKERKNEEGSLARLPDGALRSPPKLQVSDALKRSVASKGWGPNAPIKTGG